MSETQTIPNQKDSEFDEGLNLLGQLILPDLIEIQKQADYVEKRLEKI